MTTKDNDDFNANDIYSNGSNNQSGTATIDRPTTPTYDTEIVEALAESTQTFDKPRSGRTYFKGAMPLAWFTTASPLPGKALAVGVALWFRAGLTKSATVKMSGKLLRHFDIKRDAGRRGLFALERAGLVSVDRGPGRCPKVTIQESSPIKLKL